MKIHKFLAKIQLENNDNLLAKSHQSLMKFYLNTTCRKVYINNNKKDEK